MTALWTYSNQAVQLVEALGVLTGFSGKKTEIIRKTVLMSVSILKGRERQ